MLRTPRAGRAVQRVLLTVAVAGLGGCAGRDVVYPGARSPDGLFFPAEPIAATPVALPKDRPLTLEVAVETALANHPDLQAAAAQIDEARGQFVQAGLYPNPTVGYAAEQMGSRGGAGGQQGPFFQQELVTGGKLGLDQAAAREAWTAAEWQAVSRRFELETKVRSAFYEVLAAQREVSETEAVVTIASENVETSKKFEQAGRATRPDVLRASVELETNRNRLAAARKRLEAAWPLLANALGLPDTPAARLKGDLESGRPQYNLKELLDLAVNRSSEVMQAQAELTRAERLADRARVQNTPNLEVRVQPLYDFSESVGQVSAEVGVKLPLWNKNQGTILAADAEIARRAAELQAVRLRLRDRVIAAHQRFATAREQAERFEKEILPQAKEALRLSLVAFQASGADFNYTALLDAQRTLAQARLAYVQALGELWKAAAEIEGWVQRTIVPPSARP